jgi:hypothetical protein
MNVNGNKTLKSSGHKRIPHALAQGILDARPNQTVEYLGPPPPSGGVH